MQQSLISQVNVTELLPQKAPFVMLDKLFEYTPVSLVSGFLIKKDNLFFDRGGLAEAGLIEHMAQSVALHTGYTYFLKQEPAPIGYIGSIKTIEIRELPMLGDEIRTTIEVLHEFAGVTLVDISTKLNGQEIAYGQMKTAIARNS